MAVTKQTQILRLAKLLCKSKRGLTSVDIQLKIGTVCPHKRISDLKEAGICKVTKIPTSRDGCKFAYRAVPL